MADAEPEHPGYSEGRPAAPDAGLAGGLSAEEVRVRTADDSMESKRDLLAREVPVALVYNGVSHAVMLASPTDLEDFARGFSLTEGIVDRGEEIFSVTLRKHDTAFEAELHIHGACMQRLQMRRRMLTGTSGCGLCGLESLDAFDRALPTLRAGVLPSARIIDAALRALPARQIAGSEAGTVHAAAWCDGQGEIVDIREDIGRHNALDKLIGARMARSDSTPGGFVLLSSRASHELVAKAAMAGITTLVAISGATTLARDTARRAGIHLIGFARPSRHVIYHQAGRAEPTRETMPGETDR